MREGGGKGCGGEKGTLLPLICCAFSALITHGVQPIISIVEISQHVHVWGSISMDSKIYFPISFKYFIYRRKYELQNELAHTAVPCSIVFLIEIQTTSLLPLPLRNAAGNIPRD